MAIIPDFVRTVAIETILWRYGHAYDHAKRRLEERGGRLKN